VDLAGESLANKTFAGAAWLIAWRVVTRSLGLLSTLIMARILLPADFGIIAMASTFSYAVDGLSQLGLSDALVRSRGRVADLFDTAFTLQFVRACLTALLLAALGPAAVSWFNEPRLLPVLLMLAGGALISGVENIGIAEFRRDMRFAVQFRLATLPRLIQVACTLPLALALHNYWALLCGILIAKLARTVMSYMIHPYRPRLGLFGWRELAGFSFWTWATSLAALVWNRCDPFVLGPALGPTALGLYLVAIEIGTLPVSELVAPISEALFVTFAAAQHSGTSSTRHAPLVAVSLFIGIFPAVIGIAAAAGYVVVVLLGPHWAAAQPLVAISVWLCPFSVFSYVSGTVLVANGYVQRNFTGNLLASAAKLAVLVAAVSLSHDLSVIALAAAICVGIESVVFFTLLRGTGGVELGGMLGATLRAMLAGAASIGLLLLTGLGWHPVAMPVLPALLIGSAIGLLAIASFAAVLLGLWLLAGRPDGPEAQVLHSYLVPAVRVLRHRLLRRLRGEATSPPAPPPP
jgi:lipopolysaccharide exporter